MTHRSFNGIGNTRCADHFIHAVHDAIDLSLFCGCCDLLMLISCDLSINSNNISLHAMAFGSKMDKPSSSQEGGVVGLNFHQSKEVLINETNGSVFTVCYTRKIIISQFIIYYIT